MSRTAHIRQNDADHEEHASRRPGRPRDPGYDKTILDAALEILTEKGYAGLTIDGVAARTGVGRPTIYRRWASKPELVIAALAQGIGLSPTPDTGVLRDDLLAFARDQVRMMNAPESRRVTAGLVADGAGIRGRKRTVCAARQGHDRGLGRVGNLDGVPCAGNLSGRPHTENGKGNLVKSLANCADRGTLPADSSRKAGGR